MTRQYPVIYEWTGKNFSGYAPDVPGCIATAKTLVEMRSMLKSALEAHLQWMKRESDPIPGPSEAVIVDMDSDKEFPQPPGYYVVVERLALLMPRSEVIGSRSKVAKLTNDRPAKPARRRVLEAA